MISYSTDGHVYTIPSYSDPIDEKVGAVKAFTDFADSMPNLTDVITNKSEDKITIALDQGMANKIVSMTTFADITIKIEQDYSIAEGSQFFFLFNQDIESISSTKTMSIVPGSRVFVYPDTDLTTTQGGIPIGFEQGWPFASLQITKLYSSFNKDYYYVANSWPEYKTDVYASDW